jgi:hypothetical protein
MDFEPAGAFESPRVVLGNCFEVRCSCLECFHAVLARVCSVCMDSNPGCVSVLWLVLFAGRLMLLCQLCELSHCSRLLIGAALLPA